MKRGFTLVELLAVIVILAIISLIAVPIVINIINDSKYESQKRSIDLYAKALEQAVANYQLKTNKKVEGRFITTDGKTLTRDDTTLNVDYKGNVVCNRIVVNKDGSIYLSECTVDDDKVYISKDEIKKENPTYYEYGKTEYGMIMENKSHSSKFLNTGVYGSRISQFKISNTLDIKDKETYESADCSYNKDSSVMCFWKELENNPGYYNIILASDGEMYTPVDSTYLFADVGSQINNFKFDLTGLNTSKTTNMSHMFEGTASNARPKDINLGDKFDTSKVTNMSYMFKSAFKMPQDDNGYWYRAKFKLPNSFNTSKVTNMSHMFESGFYNAELLDLGDNFDTSNVVDMSYMFANTFYMGNLNLRNKFNTSKVTNMSHMFEGTGSHHMKSLDLCNNFNTKNVTDMSYMFKSTGSGNLITLNLGDKFDTLKVTNMSHMFDNIGKNSLKSLILPNNFNTKNVIDMSYMFFGMESLEELNLGENFDTSNVETMSYMFGHLKSINNTDFLNKLNVVNVIDMQYMFEDFGYNNIINISLGSNFNTSNVTNMQSMFKNIGYKNLKSLNLGSNFNTSKVTNMSHMFEGTGYSEMASLILGNNFNTSNVKTMDGIFQNTGYKKLKKLDLGKKFFANSNAKYYELNYRGAFNGLGHDSMEELYLWDFYNYTRPDNYGRADMFKDCGTEGILTKVVVSTDNFKNTLINDSNVPQFWKDNNIIQVQAP